MGRFPIAFEVLTQGDIARTQKATETLLETTGFRVTHPDLRAKAKAAGAKVEDTAERVRIPKELLRELVAQVPATFHLSWQDGTQVTFGEGTPHCLAIVTDPCIIDYERQQPRRPVLDDLRVHSVIAQKMGCVAAASRMDFPVADIEGPHSSLRALEEHLLHFGKHYCVLAATRESFQQWLEIGTILADGRDLGGSRLITVGVAVVSPLTLAGINGDLLLQACDYDFPVTPTICPMAGSTSPYTLAGTLLQGHAENLFIAALTQMVRPGHPFLYGFGPSVTNLRSMRDLYYTLDKVLWKAAQVQLAKAYGLPCSAECGGSLTYRYDPQNGAEGILFMAAARASGADMLSGIGSCHNANGMSAEMMVIHEAWLRAAEHLLRGIPMDETKLALDRLMAAGPGAHFLTDDLTLSLMGGDEFFHHELFDFGGGYEETPSMLERAHEKVATLMAECDSPLPGKVQENLRRYFHDEYKKLGV
ncbi:MAG: trimethylamine methyltransferase family protein [Candidatus Hydrogenedentota bacterium]